LELVSNPLVFVFHQDLVLQTRQRMYVVALPCLRFSSQTGKKVPVSYPADQVYDRGTFEVKTDGLKAVTKDAAEILGVSKNRSSPQIQFIHLKRSFRCGYNILTLGYIFALTAVEFCIVRN
jgi:hypothetical protein